MNNARLRLLALTLWIASHTCGALAQTPGASEPEAKAAAEPASGSIHNSMLDAELFYNILIAELQLQQPSGQGNPRDAYVLLLDAARRSGDERLFERATQIAMRSGNLSTALQTARVWKREQPQSSLANQYLVELLIAHNRIEESVSALRQELRRAPLAQRVSYILRIPQGYASVADKASLPPLFERALSEYLKSDDRLTASASWITLGRLHRSGGNAAAALAALRTAASLTPDSGAPMLLAIELLDPSSPEPERMVLDFLTRHPTQLDIRFAFARALIQQDRFVLAREHIERVIALKPDWPTPHLILGTLAHELDDNLKAQQSLERYLQLSESLPEAEQLRGQTQAWMVLSAISTKAGDYDKALYWLDKVQVSNDPLSVLTQKARILIRQGQLEEALDLIAQYPAEDTSLKRRKWLIQGQLLKEQQLDARAFELIRSARVDLPTDPDLLFEQAMLAEKINRFDLMESLLREHMALKPDDHAAYNALGYFLADRNTRLDEAKALIETALTKVPGDPYVSDSLGWVEFRLGNLDKALDILRTAYQKKPDPEIGAHLAEVYWALNRKDLARRTAQEAFKLSRQNKTLNETIRRLGLSLSAP